MATVPLYTYLMENLVDYESDIQDIFEAWLEWYSEEYDDDVCALGAMELFAYNEKDSVQEFLLSDKCPRNRKRRELIELLEKGGTFPGPRDYGGDPIVILTYNNRENNIDQDFQCVLFDQYVFVSVHGGCDIRGGYAWPRAFSVSEDGAGFAWDTSGRCMLSIHADAEPEGGERLTWYYDGDSWESQDGEPALEDVPFVDVDDMHVDDLLQYLYDREITYMAAEDIAKLREVSPELAERHIARLADNKRPDYFNEHKRNLMTETLLSDGTLSASVVEAVQNVFTLQDAIDKAPQELERACAMNRTKAMLYRKQSAEAVEKMREEIFSILLDILPEHIMVFNGKNIYTNNGAELTTG